MHANLPWSWISAFILIPYAQSSGQLASSVDIGWSTDRGVAVLMRRLGGPHEQANQKQALIVSTEGLSLLRHDDEVERLNTILGAEMLDIVPILVLRDKAAFLKSFRKQILKHADRELSNDPASINYVEQDSWLADFGAIKSLWRKHFGEDALRIIDYDQAMKRDEDVLPAALKAMDLPESFIPVAGSVRLNTDTFKARIKRFLRKVGLGS